MRGDDGGVTTSTTRNGSGDGYGDGEEPPAPSSRLCVKNVPKHLKEARLREHFASQGEVTDVKIVRTADGTSRQMAFVGFKTEAQATKALGYFDKTFIDTSRIEVQYARSVHSAAIPRPWSKYSVGSSANKDKEEKEKKSSGSGKGKGRSAGGDGEEEGERWIGAREAKKLAKQKLREKYDPMYKAEQMMKEDPKFREFMELMLPGKHKFWNDGFFENQDALESIKSTQKALEEDGDAGSSDDEYQDFDGGDSDSEGAGEDEADSDESSDEDSDSEEDDDSEKLANDDKVSDMDYFKSKQSTWNDDEEEDGSDGSDSSDSSDEEDDSSDSKSKSGSESESGDDTSDDDDDDDEDEEDSEDEKEKSAEAEKKDAPEDVNAADMEALSETGRVFVRNLPYTATEEEVAALFEQFGKLTAVHILVDRSTKRSKGLAYVTFALPEDGVKAMEAIDGSIFQGRLIHLLPAKRAPQLESTMGGVGRTGEGAEEEDEKKNSFKSERDAERKADAGNTKAWNSLFMRQDTVAAAIAAHYGVTKAELLESGADDLAVRMALGEAHVIATTKEQLSEAGVDADSLEQSAASSGAKSASRIKRSNCVLLLKNLPYEAEEDELRELCEKFGGLARFILPDTRTIAVAEFLEPAEARRAFTGLAYKRYRHVPLYLEWAPEGIFSTGSKVDIKGAKALAVADATSDLAKEAREKTKAKVEAANDLGGKTANEDAKSIFIKGLDFGTVENKLRTHFLPAAQRVSGQVLSTRIVMHRGPGGKMLSRGFGFVELDSHKTAKSVLRALQGSSLDGKTLKLELSTQGQGAGDDDDDKLGKVPKGYSATKLVIRNVAFEATKRDIQKLFNPFGTLKQVRLPKKFDGAHRGFAFVEFNTRRETQAAMDALKGTHLYGRHIIIERAADDDDVETIRKKTTSKFDANEKIAKRARLGM